jgi:hypothetical protein
LVEAAKGSFDFSIGRELAAFGLGETVQHIGEMGRIDVLNFFLADQAEHRMRDFVLTLGRQAPDHIESFLQEFRHDTISPFSPFSSTAFRRRTHRIQHQDREQRQRVSGSRQRSKRAAPL